MAIPFIVKNRQLIPNWRSFKTTLHLGELDPTFQTADKIGMHTFHKREEAWKESPGNFTAAELLNASAVLGFESEATQSAAAFIRDHPKHSSVSMLSLAGHFLNRHHENREGLIKMLESFEEFDEINLRTKIHRKIARVKHMVVQFPRNPILWVELARLYSIIGQVEQAKRAIRVGYVMAPENRFVLRAFARFFVHINESDIAHDILRNSPLVKADPWITSAEIAVAGIRGRQSKFVSVGRDMLQSKNYSPFSLTELCGSIATLELENGSIKKSRQFFEQSLISPNDNSLAQVEWAIHKEKKLNLVIPEDFFVNSFEAAAYDSYYNNDWKSVLINCAKWFMDTPHSQNSLVVAHQVAVVFLKDYELGIKLCNAGLISHPNDALLLNNLAYDLGLLNRTEEAMKEIQKAEMDADSTSITKICILATKGLIHYRMNRPEIGRQLYLDAMTQAKKESQNYYLKLALFNFCREELLLNTSEVQKYMDQIQKVHIEPFEKDLLFLKQEILKLANVKGFNIVYSG